MTIPWPASASASAVAPASRRHALVVTAVALGARLAVVAWAAGTIPPAADGQYYDKLATRIAEGHGYTWLWPDGAVTYAAHYPVGYPALVALGYYLFGTKPVVAMLLNALIGVAGAVASWSLVARASSSRLALAAGIAVALHPVLVPYTAAVMTEGVTASLLAVAAALAAWSRALAADRDLPSGGPGAPTPIALRALSLGATGLLMGVATLVRPQSLALAPIVGWLAAREPARGRRPVLIERRWFTAAIVSALTLAVCAPWTARNCARMDRCALVSVNGGWNLAIGTQTETGGWQEIAVPEACKTVFQEAAKDECFGREARKAIAASPGAWLRRIPAKLRVTFDYFGAAPWYLHTANPARFPYRAKVALGAIETLASRLALGGALVAVAVFGAPSRGDGRWLRRFRAAIGPRQVVAGIGLVACVLVPGTIGYLALAAAIALLGARALARAPLLVPFTAAVVVATGATHAVFFGSGRYGLVVVPFVTALAFVRQRPEPVENEAKSAEAATPERPLAASRHDATLPT